MKTSAKRTLASLFGVLGIGAFIAASHDDVAATSEPNSISASMTVGKQCLPFEQGYGTNLEALESDTEKVFTSGCGGLF